ncbi:hypothetical protein [Alkanindiges illinoisensis]|uniref:hypothetical protein n=1 Tax=Alkanindiges illinoisensis TaxID=197183 RepID=UPI00047EF1E5|nr:hypothetical protein [Alkanindiges illinoisensis]
MKLIPYFVYKKISDRRRDEIIQFLKSNSTADDYSLFTHQKTNNLLISRMITDNNFIVRRNINYRNSFLPIALGRIIEINNKTYINISVRMHWLIIIFSTIWFTPLFFAFIALLYIDTVSIEFILGVFGLIIGGYLLIQVSFWFEAQKLIKIFDKIFSDN